jgi:hypothetical protein
MSAALASRSRTGTRTRVVAAIALALALACGVAAASRTQGTVHAGNSWSRMVVSPGYEADGNSWSLI